MQVLNPITIGTGTFVATTLAEADYTAWAAGTAYTVGQRVIRTSTHRIYERLVAGTTATAPELDPDNWLDAAPTNAWAMFDDKLGTASSGASPITVTLSPGVLVTGVVLLGVIGTQVQVLAGATVVRTVAVPAVVSPSTSSTIVITGLSIAAGTNVVVTLTGTGTLQLAHLSVGAWVDLGETLPGVQLGMTDYSTKTVDQFGVATVTRRDYSRRLQGNVSLQSTDVQRVADVLASLRSRVAYWSFVDAYESLGTLGFVKDWSLVATGAGKSSYSITIEGLARDDAVITAGSAVATIATVTGAAWAVQTGGIMLSWTGVPGYEAEIRLGTNWSTAKTLWTGLASSWFWSWPTVGTYTIQIKFRDAGTGISYSAVPAVLTVTVDSAMQIQWVTLGATRPANLASLTGTEPILNTGITLSSSGVLSGAGGGSISLPALPGSLSSSQLGAIVDTSKFAAGIEPVGIVSSVPGTKSTTAIVNTTDGKLYRWNGAAYVAAVAAVDVTGQLTDAQLAAIAASKLTGQVTSTQITDGAISTPKLAAGSVTSAQIAADTITAGNIAAGAITASELAAGSVTTSALSAGSVTTNELAANAVTAAKIAAGAVTATQIAADAITATHIAAGAVTASELAAGAITAGSAVIADGAITNAKIDRLIASSDFNGVVDSSGLMTDIGTRGWALAKGDGSAGSSKMVIDAANVRGRLVAGQIALGGVSDGSGTTTTSTIIGLPNTYPTGNYTSLPVVPLPGPDSYSAALAVYTVSIRAGFTAWANIQGAEIEAYLYRDGPASPLSTTARAIVSGRNKVDHNGAVVRSCWVTFTFSKVWRFRRISGSIVGDYGDQSMVLQVNFFPWGSDAGDRVPGANSWYEVSTTVSYLINSV